MKKININTSLDNYDIILGHENLFEINKYIEKYDKVLVLSNDTVSSLYHEKIKSAIKRENIYFYNLPDGEEFKNIKSIYKVYDFMIEHDFTRKSLIISLGGGVICDMGGFAAATYMRGIDFIQIPTTLLAQVDASIGGKTAIDHPKGKNLIGAFKQPKLVLIDSDFLKTLNKDDFASGMGEVIKYSYIVYGKDQSFNDFLRENAGKKDRETLEEIIYRSCLIKKDFVERDELENGDRALLNLGHTYAHALETLFHFKGITHGEAVSKGVIFEMELSNLAHEFIDNAKDLFIKNNINPNPIYFEEEIMLKTLQKDKKNSFGNINFILFDESLNIYKDKVSEKDILKTLRKYKNRYVKGIIDIGTNSCRLFLAQVLDNEKISIEKDLLKEVEIVKLGQDLTKNHYLLEEAIKRSVEAIKKYKEIAGSYGCINLKAFATSATRDAENSDVFLKKVREIPVEIDCITGDTEARYNFFGNTQAFDEKILVIDIGGGSTEFALGQGDNIEFMQSLDIGAVRGKEIYQENIEKLTKWVYNNLKTLNIDIRKENFDKLVGVAGTLTTQVSVREKMTTYDRDIVHKYELTMDDISKNLDLFMGKTLEDRKKIVGLEEKRADVIVPGTIILMAIMQFLNKDKITVSESDNLNGAMVN